MLVIVEAPTVDALVTALASGFMEVPVFWGFGQGAREATAQ